ncbi:MAG: LysE family translocator [Clostridia bacterium]
MDFLQGVVFGLTLQLSVGPVFFALVQRALSRGWREGVKMAAGVTVVDAGYMAASAFGAASLLLIPAVKQVLLWGGAALLLWFAGKLLRSGEETAAATERIETSSFTYGMVLTLGNPLTILFWSGVYGSLLASGSLGGSGSLFRYSLGCAASTFLFLGATALLAGKISRHISGKTVKRLNQLVGCVLVVFAIGLLYRAWESGPIY